MSQVTAALPLVPALLVPWAWGYCILRLLSARLYRRQPAHVATLLGYGLFVGLAVACGLLFLTHQLSGQLLLWPLLLLLLLSAALAYWLTPRPQPFTDPALHTRPSSWRPLLFGMLLCWCILHLGLALAEVLQRPMYPWDAWLNWMYRAKTWYLLNDITPFSGLSARLEGPTSPHHAIPGHHYPPLLPLLALWQAEALGNWSDSLVNLNTIFCGIGLGLGLYGQSRSLGASPLLALIAAYLLLSLPLLNAHLALAGMADLWMTAYAGLGMVALLQGLSSGRNAALGLGFAMLLIATTVKQEGVLWLALGVTLVGLSRRPRTMAVLFLLGLATAGLLWVSGMTTLEVPGLGAVGFQSGQLLLPWGKQLEFGWQGVGDAYARHLFQKASWHLLWGMLTITSLALLLRPRHPCTRTVWLFTALLVSSQLALFGLTSFGEWAEDGSALNRVLLQLAPALVFCIVAPLARAPQPSPQRASSSRSRTAFIPLATLALLAAVFLLALRPASPQTTPEPLILQPEDMQLVLGGGTTSKKGVLINAYEKGLAILSSGPIAVEARELTDLQVRAEVGDNRESALFWRTESTPAETRILDLGTSDRPRVDLERHPEWQGTVIELGLVFHGNNSGRNLFQGLKLAPASLQSQIASTWQRWQRREILSFVSLNWIEGGRDSGGLTPVLVLTTWLGLSAAALALALRHHGGVLPALFPWFLLAWMALDLRWTANLLSQVAPRPERNAQLSTLPVENDAELAAFAKRALKRLPREPQHIAIVAAANSTRFQVFRLKYHLLPHMAFPVASHRELKPEAAPDYFLLLSGQGGTARPGTCPRLRFAGMVTETQPLISEAGIGHLCARRATPAPQPSPGAD